MHAEHSIGIGATEHTFSQKPSERRNDVMRLIDEWHKFEKRVVPADAGPIQRQEMRLAFYGGAWVVICIIRAMVNSDVSSTAAQAILGGIEKDCITFAEEVAKEETNER